MKTIYVIRKSLIKYSKKLSTQVKCTSLRKKDGRYKKKKTSQFKLPSQKIRLKIKKIQKVKSKKGLSYHKSNSWLAFGLKGFQEILLESLIKFTKKKLIFQ